MSWGPVQIIPPGLLGFLQLKNVGRNPDQLGETYIPGIEMRDWLFEQRIETASVSGTVAAGVTGFQATTPTIFIVPDDETWYVMNMSVHGPTLVAGETAAGACAYNASQNGSFNTHFFFAGDVQQMVGPAAGTADLICSSNYPFFVNPGGLLGYYAAKSEWAAGTRAFTVKLRFCRLPR